MHDDKLNSHVIVVRGGTDPEQRHVSLSSGSSVFHTLRGKYEVRDAHLTISGEYELDGRKVNSSDFLAAGATIFSTLRYKDGSRLQRTCQEIGAAYTGNSHTFFSETNAVGRKGILQQTGVPTIPYWRFGYDLTPANSRMYGSIIDELRYPIVVSPLPSSFSADALIAASRDELLDILQACLFSNTETSVSEAYDGQLYAVLVSDSFRGQTPYSFPARELHHNHDAANAFSRSNSISHKVTNDTRLIVQMAEEAFRQLHLRDLAEVVILKTPKDDLYVLDVDPHPPLDRHSLLSDVARDVGSTFEEVFSNIVKNADNRLKMTASLYGPQSAWAGK